MATGIVETVAQLAGEGFPTFKTYTWLPDFVARGADYLSLFRAVGAVRGMQLFHCEDDALLEFGRRRVVESGMTSPAAYGRSKPVAIEVAAVERTLRLAEAAGVRSYLVHISAADALAAVERARARGADAFVETRPIYLHLTEERYDALRVRWPQSTSAPRPFGPHRTARRSGGHWRTARSTPWAATT